MALAAIALLSPAVLLRWGVRRQPAGTGPQERAMARAQTPEIQQYLKDYWVGERIGTGARSEIYEIKHRSDGRLLAAKFVPVRGPEDLRIAGHLQNEYTVLSAIQKERTTGVAIAVRVEEFRKVKRLFKVTAAYLIMERLAGTALAAKHDYELDALLTILRQVCLGIEHTHQAGYVHADLKPENILVGEHLDVKIIDFGFAAPIGTQLSGAKGTFGFLAPEQAGGRLTQKTDVFNLGAVLYWALTGQTLPSIMPGQHEAVGFVPSDRVVITPPVQLNPNVPGELSDMVLHCCKARPEDRPTVRELKQYLHGLQLRMEMGAV
jgi:serine/threonine protein kinase